MASFFEEIDGVSIHYEKVGTGPQVLLLIPGAIGCGRSDFPDQLNGGLDQSQFTMIAIDLPGYGKSRPPERVYTVDCYANDAKRAGLLMQKLAFKSYSVLGWNDGAKVALLLAINLQSRVDKLIVWGLMPNATDYDLKALSKSRQIESFSERQKQLYIETYGKEVFERLWHKHVDYCVSFTPSVLENWDIREEMRRIKCPTLILHGDQDLMIDKNHPKTSEREIADSHLIRFPNGTHNLHQILVQEFNQTVTDFLTG